MMWNLSFGKNIECAIEAILFSMGEAVEVERIAQALEVSENEVREAFNSLKQKYEEEKRGIRLIEIDNSIQMCSGSEYYECIQRVAQTKKQSGLSSAALETLSIIAYNQPVTKATVDFIRGVDCTYSVARLVERGFIDELGRAETPGRPILYGTTMEFLRCFGLKSLDDLPPLPEKENLSFENDIPQKTDVIEDFVNENAEKSDFSEMSE
ncbi:MAG: SMC-Scp complex subunit ScpB [Clostridia bacterium]|nr:SMC-Scp complex subunit ScpB [Clostridia bacterium]